MTTAPKWINRIGREHRAEAVAIWEEHRKAVREARRVFDEALAKLKAKRDRAIAPANEWYREAKRELRDRAATAGDDSPSLSTGKAT